MMYKENMGGEYLTHEAFYGSAYAQMINTEHHLLDLIACYPKADPEDVKPIVYVCSRIKKPDSMIAKLKKRSLPPNKQAALTEVFDAIGIRVVCSFTEDVYRVASWLSEQPYIKIIKTKDYIAYPKSNGYRSYHMQVEIQEGAEKGLLAEIQVRTIATDFWATLEHQIKYKKDLPHENLIRDELKRCADEIASVDLSMQTIRDIIKN